MTGDDRKVLIPVRPDEMPLGAPLPWPLYGRAGQLIAKQGFVVATPAHRDKLLEAAPRREARGIDASEAKDFLAQLGESAGPNEAAPLLPSTGQRDPLARLRHNVESVRLSFSLPGDLEPRKATVAWIGRMPGQALIVGAPHLGGSRSWHHFEGLDLQVRLMCGRGMYAFESRILRFAAAPGAHLFLAHPRVALHKQIREATRVAARLPVLVQASDGPGVAAVLVDISGMGCALETDYLLGELGARVDLSFRVTVHGQSHTLTLPALLKNQRTRGRTVTAGLQFDPAALRRDWHLPLILKSFVYERMLDV